VQHEALVITTPEWEEEHPELRVYPVADLVYPIGAEAIELEQLFQTAAKGSPSGAFDGWCGSWRTPRLDSGHFYGGYNAKTSLADYYTLVNMIESCIAPDTWDCVGGPAALEVFPNADAIVVAQSIEAHEQIERLLTDMRRELAKTKDKHGAGAPATEDQPGKGGAPAATKRQINLETVVYFVPSPLDEAAKKAAKEKKAKEKKAEEKKAE